MESENLIASITLDEIVNQYLDQHQMPQSKYRRIYSIAIRGYRLMYRDSTGFPQQVSLPILANQTSVLPTNLMSIISVGVLNQRGEVASLTYDPLLAIYDSTNPNRLNQPTQETLATDLDVLFSLQDAGNLGYVGYGQFGQYGVGSQPVIGFYNIDWQNRVMLYNFQNVQPNNVYVQYLGLPCEDGEYVIHPFFTEALVAYINWQDSVGNPRKSKGERQLNKHDFDVEYRNARFASTPFDPSQMFNQFRQEQRIAPKT
jgi:hypothetical protein